MKYSMPEPLVLRWLNVYGEEVTEKMLADFLEDKPLTVRCRTYLNSVEKTCESLRAQGVTVEPAPYLPMRKGYRDTIISLPLTRSYRERSRCRM